MVFLFRKLHTSFASELIKWINSVQQFKINSRLSFATRIDGTCKKEKPIKKQIQRRCKNATHTNSFIILFILARGRVKSSSSAEGGGHSSSCGLFIVLCFDVLCVFITFVVFISLLSLTTKYLDLVWSSQCIRYFCLGNSMPNGTIQANFIDLISVWSLKQ